MKNAIKKIFADTKILSIIVLAIVALSVAGYLLSAEPVKPFKIQDRCGVFVNLESHTIPDEETCQTRCRAQCISSDYSFKKVEFTMMEAACHECMCYCK